MILTIAVFAVLLFSSCEKSTDLSLKIPVLPSHPSNEISFVDKDKSLGELQGDIIIQKASDESDITHYFLYSADGSSSLLDDPIATFPKTGSDMVYILPPDSLLPSDVSRFIVITGINDDLMVHGCG